MSLLRIYGSPAATPDRCAWALVNDGREPLLGEGRLAELPGRAGSVQLVLPATQVMMLRARLPGDAKRLTAPVLAFAIEDQITGDPDAQQVTCLGAAGDDSVLAVVDKEGLQRWRDALDAAGVHAYDIQCETLLLPRKTNEWSLAWDGREGYVRSGEFEGAATDAGDRGNAPLALRMMLDEARQNHTLPAAIAVYPAAPEVAPDLEAWQQQLGIPLRAAARWNWWNARPEAGTSLGQQRRRWRADGGMIRRLRPAAWILGIALAVHAAALIVDWTSLAHEQRTLRERMETRFRATFPDAVAVADPALQMRRKLAEARHAAGQSDSSDFLPMVDRVGAAVKDLPAGSVRILSYEAGRITIELAATDAAVTPRLLIRLQQSGLRVDAPLVRQQPAGVVVITARSS